MTDNEIIKALEYCCKVTNCEVDCDRKTDCILLHLHEVVDLINRKDEMINGLIAGQETLQKGMAERDKEIERLQKEKFDSLNSKFAEMYATTLKIATNKKLKEFANEFEKRCIAGGIYPAFVKKQLYNLLKEMEGETNGTR